MSQPTFGSSNIAFANTSRSFANMGTPTTSDNKSNGNTLSSTYAAKRDVWSTNNIWGNGSMSNGFNSRDVTRDSSRGGDSRSPPTDQEAGERKTGSSSLVDSSVSDAWTHKTPWGTKRSLTSGRSISQAQYPEMATSQHRSASNAGIPTTFTNTTQSSLFASRAAPISLNTTAPAQTRIGSTAAYPFGVSGRVSEPAPNVYTKWDRPADPNARKQPDSAKDGVWTDYSPTEERKPFNITFGSQISTPPVSRDGSIPSSYRGTERTSFTYPDYSHPSQQSTQNNSRAPSISSQSNGAYNNDVLSNSDANRLAWHLNHLDITGGDRPSTSHRGSNGSAAMFSHPSPGSAVSPHTHSAMPGSTHPFCNNVDCFYLDTRRHEAPQTTSAFSEFTPNSFAFRVPQANGNANRGSRHQLANTGHPQSGSRLNSGGFGLPNSALAMGGRFSDQQEQLAYAEFQLQQQMLDQFRNPMTAVYNPYGIHQAFPINGSSGYVSLLATNGSPTNAASEVFDTMPRTGDQVQSALLGEFKVMAKQKNFTLKDIYDHIPEFSGDQHGSRFIQTKLENANSDEKDRVFQEIEPNAIQLMMDVFGNYVIQKFFEHGDQRHKRLLANKMKGEVLNLTLQMYGCRVVQKALDHVLVDQQAELISELQDHVLHCVKDQNGNHVVQKAIERCPPATIAFIVHAIRGDVHHLSTHGYGCRVIQRCLERCEPRAKAVIMQELMKCMTPLIEDQFGNYVVQHVVQHDRGEAKMLVLDMIAHDLERYCRHKFASNVVEKCLEQSSDEWRHQVVLALMNGPAHRSEGEGTFVSMIKDSYGNYVIQKLLDTLKPDDYLFFISVLQPALIQAKRTGCGKQVLSIEKKMSKFPPYRGGPTNGGAYNIHNHRMPIPQFTRPVDSAATTPPPPLKSDRGSLQSSALTSIDGDAVEGAHALVSRKLREQSPGNYYR